MSDKEIIELFLARDEAAIRITSEKYGHLLQMIAENVLGNEEDARECVNDVLMNVWNLIPPENPIYFKAFIAKLCRNIALNRLDWNNAIKRKAEIVELTREMEGCIPSVHDLSEEMDRKEIKNALSDYVKGLSDFNQLLFVRRYWFGDSIEQLSKQLGYSSGYIKVMLYRQRKHLKKYLEERGVRL